MGSLRGEQNYICHGGHMSVLGHKLLAKINAEFFINIGVISNG